MAECRHRRRAGIVTNVDPAVWGTPDDTGALSSRNVCGRLLCVQDAQRRVAADTNAEARFYPDPQPPIGSGDRHTWAIAEDQEPSAADLNGNPVRTVWACREHQPPHQRVVVIRR